MILSLHSDRRSARQGLRSRSGSVILLVMLMITLLLSMVCLVVDAGYIYSRKAWLQSVADSAVLTALAAVDEDGTFSEEDSELRTIVSQTSAANGLGSSFFQVLTIKNPGTDDLLVARIQARFIAPAAFAMLLGISEWGVGVAASAEVLPELIIASGGGLALFGDILVDAQGTVFVDSYDSRDGPYSPTSVGPDGKPYANSNATIGGNGDADIGGDVSFHGDVIFGENIEISGTAGFIMGNALAGGGITGPESAITGHRIGGFPVPEFNPEPATLPPGTDTTNDNGLITGYFDPVALSTQSRLVKGSGAGDKVIYIPAGKTYYFNEIDLASDIRLELTGLPSAQSTLFYLNGPMKAVGGIVNSSGVPKATDLRIISVAPEETDGSIRIGGNAAIYADIYAPQQPFTLAGGGALYGRIFGETLDLQGNTSIHYDEALPRIEGGVFVTEPPKRRPHLVD